MTIQIITGFDLLNDLGNDDSDQFPNISAAVNSLGLKGIDSSITSTIGNYADENWGVKTKGSDSYNSDSIALQTLAFKSVEGSSVTLTKQYNSGNNYLYAISANFISSDKSIIFDSSYSDTNSKFNGHFNYTNKGENGADDDISIVGSITHINTTKTILKNGIWSGSENKTHTLKYTGGIYKIDIDAKSIEKFSYNDDYTSNTNIETYTISKYSFENTENGFSLILSGVLKVSNVDGEESDEISISKVTLTSSDYKLTGSKILFSTPQSLANINDFEFFTADTMQSDIESNLVPNLTNGDNNISIKNIEGIQIDAGAGKDTVIGAAGDDTIIGGAGSDKLTGGKGTDTFTFSNADFYTENTDGDSVFNKSVDTITDFNLKEHDVLDFGDLGELSFYAKIADAKGDNAHLFYVKGSGSVYLNTSTTDGFTPTVIITLTGKPALNVDGKDWGYPV